MNECRRHFNLTHNRARVELGKTRWSVSARTERAPVLPRYWVGDIMAGWRRSSSSARQRFPKVGITAGLAWYPTTWSFLAQQKKTANWSWVVVVDVVDDLVETDDQSERKWVGWCFDTCEISFFSGHRTLLTHDQYLLAHSIRVTSRVGRHLCVKQTE